MQTTIHDQSRVRSNGRYILMTKVPHCSTDKLTKEHSQRESKCINIDNFIIAIVFQGPASAPAIAVAAALGTNLREAVGGRDALPTSAWRVESLQRVTQHCTHATQKKVFSSPAWVSGFCSHFLTDYGRIFFSCARLGGNSRNPQTTHTREGKKSQPIC